jgi:hypothetical protein
MASKTNRFRNSTRDMQQVAEVVTSYAHTILEVVHIGQAPGRDAYLIGEGPEANFKVGGADLPNPAATTLVSRTDDGFVLAFTPSMRGNIEWGEQSVSLADLVASGRTQAGDGVHRYMLPRGAKAKIMHGDVRFDISVVDRSSVVVGRAELDWPFWSYLGGTATLGTVFYLLMRSMPADAMAMHLDEAEASARFAKYFHQADEQEQDEPVVADVPSEDRSSSESPRRGDNSRVTSHAGNGRSDRNARSARDGAVARGPRGGVPHFDRGYDPLAAAGRAGMLDILAQQDRQFLASTGAFMPGTDDGHVWANASGMDHGIGGLETTDSGRFGGVADGVVGVDGLLGDGVGSSGQPGGLRHGTPNGKHADGFDGRKAKIPSARIDKDTDVSGDISKDVVRRVVHGHLMEVRRCYNLALAKNPHLEGRVTIQFMINEMGKVPKSIVQDNDTKDAAVGKCIADAAKRWTFPRGGSGGIALITYPFMLTQH